MVVWRRPFASARATGDGESLRFVRLGRAETMSATTFGRVAMRPGENISNRRLSEAGLTARVRRLASFRSGLNRNGLALGASAIKTASVYMNFMSAVLLPYRSLMPSGRTSTLRSTLRIASP
jgi:hypothetical protein